MENFIFCAVVLAEVLYYVPTYANFCGFVMNPQIFQDFSRWFSHLHAISCFGLGSKFDENGAK